MRRLAKKHINVFNRPATPITPVLVRTFVYGLLSVFLYTMLFLYNETILEYSRQGHWFFFVPVSIAFIFSIVHGNFTGQFWDLFGVKAKTTKK